MLKRRLVVIALVLVLAIPAAWWVVVSFSPELSIELTQAELQTQLNAKFPAEKCLLGACLELRDPQLRLDEGADRVSFNAQFVATLGKRKMPGTATFSGKPRYEQRNHSFYLDDVQVTEFQMTGNAPDFDEVVKVRGPKAAEAILRTVPLYTLSSDTRHGQLAKLALRSVQVLGGKLRITFLNPLGWFGRA